MDDLKDIIRDLNTLLKPYQDLARIKTDNSKVIEQIENALQKIPSTSITAPLEEILGRLRNLVAAGKAGREQSFRRLEAEFIRGRREAAVPVKELDQSWRIGHFEIGVDRSQGRARLLFNREVVVDWSPIRTVQSLEDLIKTAETKMKKAEIPTDLLRESFEIAYQDARHGKASPRVSLPDFYRAFRLALVRKELMRGNPEKKLAWADMPKWSFLFNVDRYRQMAAARNEQKLNFETGSQQDQANGLGMTLNGLTSEQEYKVCCWVFKPEERQ